LATSPASKPSAHKLAYEKAIAQKPKPGKPHKSQTNVADLPPFETTTTPAPQATPSADAGPNANGADAVPTATGATEPDQGDGVAVAPPQDLNAPSDQNTAPNEGRYANMPPMPDPNAPSDGNAPPDDGAGPYADTPPNSQNDAGPYADTPPNSEYGAGPYADTPPNSENGGGPYADMPPNSDQGANGPSQWYDQNGDTQGQGEADQQGPDGYPAYGGDWVQVVVSGAAMRASAAEDAPMLFAFPYGRNLRVVSRYEGWVEVTDPQSAATGWMQEGFLAPAGTVQPGYGQDQAYDEPGRRHPGLLQPGGFADLIHRAFGGGGY
jgi:hypothetical protein